MGWVYKRLYLNRQTVTDQDTIRYNSRSNFKVGVSPSKKELVLFPSMKALQLFHDGGRFHIEIEIANQWTGFYMETASVMKELKMMKNAFYFIL